MHPSSALVRLTRFALLALVLGAASQAQVPRQTSLRQRYTFFSYPGQALTHPYAINDAGTIVGSYEYGWHGFMRGSSGSFITIDYPGATHNLVTSVNNADIAVGMYKLSGVQYSFSYSLGAFTTLPNIPGGSMSIARGVNDAGIIVGSYRDSQAQEHGYIYNGVSYTKLDYPGASSTVLTAINNQGLILGNRWTGSRWRGFVYDGSSFTSLVKPGAYWTWLESMNDQGVITGQEVDASGMVRTAIHYDGAGTWTTLQVPGATGWTAAQGVNNLGVICGYAYDASFTSEQGFIKNY